MGALLTNLRATRTSLIAEPKDFAGGLVDRSGLLALYIACMNRGVLDFYHSLMGCPFGVNSGVKGHKGNALSSAVSFWYPRPNMS